MQGDFKSPCDPLFVFIGPCGFGWDAGWKEDGLGRTRSERGEGYGSYRSLLLFQVFEGSGWGRCRSLKSSKWPRFVLDAGCSGACLWGICIARCWVCLSREFWALRALRVHHGFAFVACLWTHAWACLVEQAFLTIIQGCLGDLEVGGALEAVVLNDHAP